MEKGAKEKRQEGVLEMIIKHYTITAEPVSSQLISKDIGVSSATIRSIMIELEEMGLICQPHISAGRVPTYKGYRHYVNTLMEQNTFLEINKDEIDDAIAMLGSDSMVDVVSKCLQLCSRLTSQACVALLPAFRIKEHLLERLGEEIRNLFASLYDVENRLYLDGTHYLAEQPEFKDAKKITSILRVLEEKKGILEILEEDLKDSGVKVHIGSENRPLGFDSCSVVTANYYIEGDVSGTLGIIGPMRMEYEKVIPTVGCVAESLSSLFDKI